MIIIHRRLKTIVVVVAPALPPNVKLAFSVFGFISSMNSNSMRKSIRQLETNQIKGEIETVKPLSFVKKFNNSSRVQLHDVMIKIESGDFKT